MIWEVVLKQFLTSLVYFVWASMAFLIRANLSAFYRQREQVKGSVAVKIVSCKDIQRYMKGTFHLLDLAGWNTTTIRTGSGEGFHFAKFCGLRFWQFSVSNGTCFSSQWPEELHFDWSIRLRTPCVMWMMPVFAWRFGWKRTFCANGKHQSVQAGKNGKVEHLNQIR